MKINPDLLQSEIYRLTILIDLLEFLSATIESKELSKEQIIDDVTRIIIDTHLEEQFQYRGASI